MSSRCTCSVCGSDLTTQNGLWGCHACFPAVPAKEVERLRAENAELREDNADVHAMLQRGLMLMEAQLELDWFRQVQPWFDELVRLIQSHHGRTTLFGSQVLHLIDRIKSTPKPGAGT